MEVRLQFPWKLQNSTFASEKGRDSLVERPGSCTGYATDKKPPGTSPSVQLYSGESLGAKTCTSPGIPTWSSVLSVTYAGVDHILFNFSHVVFRTTSLPNVSETPTRTTFLHRSSHYQNFKKRWYPYTKKLWHQESVWEQHSSDVPTLCDVSYKIHYHKTATERERDVCRVFSKKIK